MKATYLPAMKMATKSSLRGARSPTPVGGVSLARDIVDRYRPLKEKFVYLLVSSKKGKI